MVLLFSLICSATVALGLVVPIIHEESTGAPRSVSSGSTSETAHVQRGLHHDLSGATFKAFSKKDLLGVFPAEGEGTHSEPSSTTSTISATDIKPHTSNLLPSAITPLSIGLTSSLLPTPKPSTSYQPASTTTPLNPTGSVLPSPTVPSIVPTTSASGKHSVSEWQIVAVAVIAFTTVAVVILGVLFFDDWWSKFLRPILWRRRNLDNDSHEIIPDSEKRDWRLGIEGPDDRYPVSSSFSSILKDMSIHNDLPAPPFPRRPAAPEIPRLAAAEALMPMFPSPVFGTMHSPDEVTRTLEVRQRLGLDNAEAAKLSTPSENPRPA